MKKDSLFPSRSHGCWVCGYPNVELHHVFPSSRRKASDYEGCTICLCRYHHQGKSGVHQDRQLDLYIKQECQRRWEEREGLEGEAAHDAFREKFFASYI